MVLVLIRFVDDTLAENSSSWLEKAFKFMDTMTSSGNRIAEFRCTELRKLESMLSEYLASRVQQQPDVTVPQDSQQPLQNYPSVGFSFTPQMQTQSPGNFMPQPTDSMSMYAAYSDESSGFGDDLTTEQILAVAESMDLGGTDWFSSFTTMGTYP